MALAGINRNPSARELRWFGALAGAFFIVIAVIAAWRFSAPIAARWIAGAGVALALVYYALPRARRAIFIGWQAAFYPLGWVVMHAVMGAVFYLVLTPTGLVLRAIGKDPLARRFDKGAASHWEPRRPAGDAASYFRQF